MSVDTDIIEKIAMLTAKGSAPDKIPGSTGTALLTQQDVAWALGGLSDGATAYAYYKYAGDLSSKEKTVSELSLRLLDIADKLSWRAITAPKINSLSTLIVEDDVEREICRACIGRGTYLKDHVWHGCQKCKNTGRLTISDRRKARALGIDHKAYTRHWTERFSAGKGVLSEWTDEIRKRLRNKL